MVIVLGVDDSANSEIAARRAVSLGVALDAEVHAVFALHMSSTMVTVMGTVPNSLTEFALEERRAVWDRIRPILDASGAVVKQIDTDGYPPDVLAQYAEDVGATMIVVGSRGRGGIASLVLGSTSHRLTHIAHCDVLVAREREE